MPGDSNDSGDARSKGIVWCIVAKGVKKLEEVRLPSWRDERVEATVENVLRKTRNDALDAIGETDALRKSYEHDGYSFNYTIADEITVLCVGASDASQRRNAFTFLDSVRRQYALTEGGAAFRSTVLEWMTQKNYDQIAVVKESLEEVKGVMRENIEKVLDRGEKLDELSEKSENLLSDSDMFRRRSHELERAMCMRKAKLIAIPVVILIIVVVLIVLGVKGKL